MYAIISLKLGIVWFLFFLFVFLLFSSPVLLLKLMLWVQSLNEVRIVDSGVLFLISVELLQDNKYLKNISVPPIIRKTQIKTTLSFPITPVRMAVN